MNGIARPFVFECVCGASLHFSSSCDETTDPGIAAQAATFGWKPWPGMPGFFLCPTCEAPPPRGRRES